ncbi:hypothetical protein [Actinomadura fibrosa]|uniref:Uncharacterized protein n=1 Tax=Actinomadura fibrosa TaxID=111802 RepID=A0ABW2XZR9_9ACTN|nr:hypothetical protein [Actinomadura fibrosa]
MTSQVNRCTVTTGFFVLGRCGRAAVAACGQCGRPVCAEHATGALCPECALAQGYAPQDPHDPAWVRGYRRRHYERSSQTYNDAYWYSSFDEYDRGAFNPGDEYSYGGGDFDDDGMDFVDS